MSRTVTFQEAIAQVKLGLDIVDVVGRQVALKRSGRNMTGLCPFHAEKTPSFNVNPARQVYKCFGCGEGGDALSFLMKIENKNFGELIVELAADMGIEIERDGRPQQPNKDELEVLYELNATARSFFQSQLSHAPTVQQYLENRQVNAHWQEKFGLGYAPEGWENLVKHLTQQVPHVQTSPMLLEKAGLASLRTEGNSFYDRFRHRLMVPIQDDRGRVVGFGGRSLAPDDMPKYLNSPETPVYVKSRILYGLFQAQESIRSSKMAILMEGYFDVIAAHMAGITQAVGVCGTALTESHLKLLQRAGAEKLYLCFDSDKAGQTAALRAIELVENQLLERHAMLYVVLLPGEKDPDDFLKSQGAEAFKACMDQAPDFLTYKFNQALAKIAHLDTSAGRIEAVQVLCPMLAAIQQPIIRQERLRQLAEQIGVDEETLQLEMKRVQKPYLGYPDKKNYAQSAISLFPQRYTDRKKKTNRFAFPSRPEDTMTFRTLLEKKLPIEEKEHLLTSMLFVGLDGYWMIMDTLTQLTLQSPLAKQFLQAIESLEGHWQTLDELLNQLNTHFHQENNPQMVSFTAQQAMMADAWLTQHESDTKGHGALDVSAKLRRDIEEIVTRIESLQHRAVLGDLAKTARSHEELDNDLAAQTAQQALKDELAARQKAKRMPGSPPVFSRP